jgi:type I restriction enzyme S subunit
MFSLQRRAEALQSQSQGVAQKGIYLAALKALPFELPPLEEQRQIVAVLDEAFAAIATATTNAEKTIFSARALFDATVSQAFTNELTPGSFEELQVKDIAAQHKGSMRTGPFGSQLLHSEFVEAGIAVLGIDNAVANEFRSGKQRYITQEKFQTLSRFLVRPGDVIITIMGTCGRCAVIPDDIPITINSKHLFCITLDRKRCDPAFLHAYFLHAPDAREYLEQRAQGAIMAGLNMGIIKEMPIRLPSLKTQAKIVEAVRLAKHTVDSLCVINQSRLAKYASLKQSLLGAAFAGELAGSDIQSIAA